MTGISDRKKIAVFIEPSYGLVWDLKKRMNPQKLRFIDIASSLQKDFFTNTKELISGTLKKTLNEKIQENTEMFHNFGVSAGIAFRDHSFTLDSEWITNKRIHYINNNIKYQDFRSTGVRYTKDYSSSKDNIIFDDILICTKAVLPSNPDGLPPL